MRHIFFTRDSLNVEQFSMEIHVDMCGPGFMSRISICLCNVKVQ